MEDTERKQKELEQEKRLKEGGLNAVWFWKR